MAFDAIPNEAGPHLRKPSAADIASVPADMLRPRGVVLCGRLENTRTAETVARHIKLFGEAGARYAQLRGWL